MASPACWALRTGEGQVPRSRVWANRVSSKGRRSPSPIRLRAGNAPALIGARPTAPDSDSPADSWPSLLIAFISRAPYPIRPVRRAVRLSAMQKNSSKGEKKFSAPLPTCPPAPSFDFGPSGSCRVPWRLFFGACRKKAVHNEGRIWESF